MSTTSLALLKGANKAALEKELSTQPEEAPVEQEATQDEEGVITAAEINKMTGAQINDLVKENEVPTPDNWSKMTVPQKKAWLIEQMEEPDENGVAEEPAQAAQEEVADNSDQEVQGEPENEVTQEPEPEPAKAKAVVKAKDTPKTAEPAKKVSNVAGKVGTAIVGVQTKEGDILLPDAISDITHELTNLKEKDAREIVRTLLEAGEQTFFKVGVALAHIQDNGWHQPYPNFKEFVQAEYGIEYRKAMYLVRIANDIIGANVPYEKIAASGLGWGKLKDISSVLTVDNVDHWIEVAQKNNSLQLQQIVADSKKNQTSLPSAASVEVTTKTFKLHKDQKELVEEALSKAKGVSSTEVDAVALEFICTEYLNTGSNKPAKVTTAALRKAIIEMGAEKAAELVAEAFPDVEFSMSA